MPHVEQQSHGCTTLASKHANHLTTSKVRAPLLRVHTTLYDARTNDRETQCDRKSRTRSPLNFKHVQKLDATAGERKIACNGSDSSCNVGEPSCECQKAGSQSVLKWSCANCERGLSCKCWYVVTTLKVPREMDLSQKHTWHLQTFIIWATGYDSGSTKKLHREHWSTAVHNKSVSNFDTLHQEIGKFPVEMNWE